MNGASWALYNSDLVGGVKTRHAELRSGHSIWSEVSHFCDASGKLAEVLFRATLPRFLGGLWGGEDNGGGIELNRASLALNSVRVSVNESQKLRKGRKIPSIIIDDAARLLLVSVPPLV